MTPFSNHFEKFGHSTERLQEHKEIKEFLGKTYFVF